MVEIAEDDVDALVLLAEQVLDGDLDVVEGDIRRPGSGGVRRLDGLCLDALAALDEQHAKPLLRPNTRDEVIAETTVRDPLLGAVDDVMLAIGRLGRRRPQARDIGPRERLRDRQTHVLLAAEDLVHDGALPLLVLHEVHHARQADDHPRQGPVLEPARVDPHPFLRHDQVVEVVELLALDGAVQKVHAVQVLPRPQPHVDDALLGHLVDQRLADVLPVGLARLGLARRHRLREHAHRLPQALVALVVVRRLVGRGEPEGFGVGHGAEVAWLGGQHRGLLALDRPDAEALVLQEHFVPV